VTEQRVGAAGGAPNDIPYLRPHPGAALFERRAARFRALAEGHAITDFLRLGAALSAAQAAASAAVSVRIGSEARAPRAPIAAAGVERGEWHAVLRLIAAELREAPMPAAARAGLAAAAALDPEALRSHAERVLLGDVASLDLAVAPFVCAALQVRYAALAAQIEPATVARAASGCPMCGALPVAGVVLGDDKLRYIACCLCGSQWHLPRVTCSRCGSTAGISYFSLEGRAEGVKAEACEACHGYLKLFYLEQRPGAEPLADDLATLPLDALVVERGYAKVGVNLLLPA